MSLELEAAIRDEQAHRRALEAVGAPLHYWQVRGDVEAPRREVWCDHCVGFYGVPHDGTHDNGLCRHLYRVYTPEGRVCACIDCAVAEHLHHSVSGSSR